MKIRELFEARVLQPKISPLRALVLEYLTFTSTGIMTIVSDGAKSPEAAEELKKVYWTLSQSNKNLQAVVNNEPKLEANKNSILKNIHDMMNYAIAHLKANMIPQEFETKKKQINSVLTKYNDLAKNESVEENFADGKKPGRKGLAKRSGVNTKASVSSLRKTAKSSSGEKQRMAHWLANMKAGKAKKKRSESVQHERSKDPVDIAARVGKLYGKEKDYGYDNSGTVPGKYIPLKNFNEEWVSTMEDVFYDIYSSLGSLKMSIEERKKLRISLDNEASSVKSVPINKLYATQPFVRIEDVEILKNKVASSKEITVINFGERLLIRDGHHAVLAARLRGETTVPAKIIDLDYLEEKYL